MSSESTIGTVIGDLFPEDVDTDAVTTPGKLSFQFSDSDQTIEAVTSRTTDEKERNLGLTIACYDITDERRRRQRIQVLNRVLRHNLRNELTVIDGYSSLLTDGGADTAEYAEQVNTHVDILSDLGDKAREIESLLAIDRTIDSPVDLNRVIEAVPEISSEASLTVTVPEDTLVRANPAILQPVVRELVENAIEHNDSPTPEVDITIRETEAILTITDNGPGIPEYEIDVFEREHETSLEHGSGLGLWLVKWGIERLGGDISFDAEGGGTWVTVRLPDSLFIQPSTEPSGKVESKENASPSSDRTYLHLSVEFPGPRFEDPIL